MVNNIQNPCISCKKDWSVDSNLSCHDTCEQYQSYKKLSESKNKMKAKFDSDILIGECLNDYIDDEGGNIEGLKGIRFAFEWLKKYKQGDI
jgi:hypothetical protein